MKAADTVIRGPSAVIFKFFLLTYAAQTQYATKHLHRDSVSVLHSRLCGVCLIARASDVDFLIDQHLIYLILSILYQREFYMLFCSHERSAHIPLHLFHTQMTRNSVR